MIFGVDNSSSSHPHNFKNHFLVLGERDNFAINGSLDPQEKELSNAHNSYVLFIEKKMLIFKLNFYWEVFLMDLVLLSLEKCPEMEMCMIFELITILLISLTYYASTSI